jgi:hypothetical protein
MNKQLETISTTDLTHVTGGFDLSSIMGMIGPMLGGLGGGGGSSGSGAKKDDKSSSGGGGGGLGSIMGMLGPLLGGGK